MGLEPCCLLNFIDANGYSRSHGLTAALLHRQAAVLGMPLKSETVTGDTYESGFIRAVKRLKEQGVRGGVFGDINLHTGIGSKKCAPTAAYRFTCRCGGMEERQVSEELLRRQGRAILVSVQGRLVEERWLGRVLDQPFLDYCEGRGLSPCGERGEFHTLVVDGPLFREPVQYRAEAVERIEQYSCLRLTAGPGSGD